MSERTTIKITTDQLITFKKFQSLDPNNSLSQPAAFQKLLDAGDLHFFDIVKEVKRETLLEIIHRHRNELKQWESTLEEVVECEHEFEMNDHGQFKCSKCDQ